MVRRGPGLARNRPARIVGLRRRTSRRCCVKRSLAGCVGRSGSEPGRWEALVRFWTDVRGVETRCQPMRAACRILTPSPDGNEKCIEAAEVSAGWTAARV